jgi:hypothetical protein
MTTSSQEIVLRCRSLLNEPLGQNDPQRTDQELLQWADDSTNDFISKVVADAFPELVKVVSFIGATWTIPTDYLKLLQVRATHLVDTESVEETVQILGVDNEYVLDAFLGSMGIFAVFDEAQLKFTSDIIGGTVKYLSKPNSFVQCEESSLKPEFDDPIVNRTVALALSKINDEGADFYLARYDQRIAAENERYRGTDVERTR